MRPCLTKYELSIFPKRKKLKWKDCVGIYREPDVWVDFSDDRDRDYINDSPEFEGCLWFLEAGIKKLYFPIKFIYQCFEVEGQIKDGWNYTVRRFINIDNIRRRIEWTLDKEEE